MAEAIVSSDACALGQVRRIAAMLDLDPNVFAEGAPLPRGWHFFLLGGATRRSALRADGFPGFGVPMPDFGLPRLMLAGRRVAFSGALTIGSAVTRRSMLANVTEKKTTSGDTAFVTIQHELAAPGSATPAIVEEQTYILLGDTKPRGAAAHPPAAVSAAHSKTITPDDTLLSQYSALCFNSHKIHIDRAYARDVEGLPDLVVNGGLAAMLLTEFLRNDLGVRPARMSMKHTAPLYSNRLLTLVADRRDDGWHLRVHDNAGVTAVSAEVQTS